MPPSNYRIISEKLDHTCVMFPPFPWASKWPIPFRKMIGKRLIIFCLMYVLKIPCARIFSLPSCWGMISQQDWGIILHMCSISWVVMLLCLPSFLFVSLIVLLMSVKQFSRVIHTHFSCWMTWKIIVQNCLILSCAHWMVISSCRFCHLWGTLWPLWGLFMRMTHHHNLHNLFLGHMTQKVELPTTSQNMAAGCVIFRRTHWIVFVTDWICMMMHHSVMSVISCRLRSIQGALTIPFFGSAQSMDIVSDFTWCQVLKEEKIRSVLYMPTFLRHLRRYFMILRVHFMNTPLIESLITSSKPGFGMTYFMVLLTNAHPHSGQVESAPLMYLTLRFVSNSMPFFRTLSTLALTWHRVISVCICSSWSMCGTSGKM